MQIGVSISSLEVNPGAGRLVRIGAYRADGVNSPVEEVVVDQDFYTPPGEVTNAQAQAVIAKHRERPKGIFLRDRCTGYHYLYAMGEGDDANTFETIEPELLPPRLGIGEGFEALADNPQALAQLELDTGNVRRVLPCEDRYQGLEDEDKFADDNAAITHISGWQAQALAQLLGDREIADRLFGIGGLGGAFYADLLTNDQWGLMAMEGVLEYMTGTGKLRDSDWKKLRAFGLSHIVPATDYPPLPNGVLPNSVWNWVKDFTEQGLCQVRRGGSWIGDNHDYLRSVYRGLNRPDCDGLNNVGLRVGYFPRT